MRKFVPMFALLLPALAFGGYHVKSFKKETKLGANYWNAASALDNDPLTCWMVDPESDNVGEWFELDLPKSEVDKLSIISGWGKDETTFKDYARIKTAKVTLFGNDKDESAQVYEQVVTFEDKLTPQLIELPDTKLGGEMTGGKVRIEVTEVYPGEDYPQLAVSEIQVVLKEQDVPNTAILFKVPPTSAAGHDEMAMTDGDLKTYWQSGAADAEFEVRAEGFGVSSVGLALGPVGTPQPKTVEISVNEKVTHVELAQVPDATLKKTPLQIHWIPLPSVIGYTGSAWGNVKVRIIDTWTPGAPAVSELKLRYTNFEGL